MNTKSVLNEIEKTTASYRRYLEAIPDANFEISPATGGWSYSEVYAHIFDLSIMSLQAIDACFTQEAIQVKTPLITRAILFFGAFPPLMKFKVPKRLAPRVKKISKSTAASMIAEFETKLQPYLNLVSQADPKNKTAHPRLGYLNAQQWIRFTEIHLKHHLKQLKRIDKSF